MLHDCLALAVPLVDDPRLDYRVVLMALDIDISYDNLAQTHKIIKLAAATATATNAMCNLEFVAHLPILVLAVSIVIRAELHRDIRLARAVTDAVRLADVFHRVNAN